MKAQLIKYIIIINRQDGMMYDPDQLSEIPLGNTVNFTCPNNSNNPRGYLQPYPITNPTNPTDYSGRVMNDGLYNLPVSQPLHHAGFGSMPTASPLHTGQQTLYYTDLETQTCTNIRTFVKRPGEQHRLLLILNIILYLSVIIGFNMIAGTALASLFLWQLIGFCSILYLSFGYCNNSLRTFFSNMKPYNQMEGKFQQLKMRTGNIKFKAQCYHFGGSKNRSRMVTHTAELVVPVRQCVDVCDPFGDIKENNRFIFYTVKNYFYFGDPYSQNSFLNAFNVFKSSNMKDSYQVFTHSLDITIPGLACENGLSLNGMGDYLNGFYIVFLLLGVGWAYLAAIEWVSQRYIVNINKRLTL